MVPTTVCFFFHLASPNAYGLIVPIHQIECDTRGQCHSLHARLNPPEQWLRYLTLIRYHLHINAEHSDMLGIPKLFDVKLSIKVGGNAVSK